MPAGRYILYSTEIAEVINLSHRVLVMYGGRIVRELDNEGGEMTENSIMRAALGGGSAAEPIPAAMVAAS